jgi:hypothetical protein
MKSFLIAALFATIATTAAWSQEAVATIKQEAQNCAKAMLASDYDGIVRYTHPRIVTQMGGKDAVIGIMKRGMAQMQAQGTGFLDATIGQPQEPKKIGSWMTSVLPQHLVMKVPGGRLNVDSSLLGISEDDGKHWVFIDLGGVTKEQFGQAFPELDGKFPYPEKKTSVFQKDK